MRELNPASYKKVVFFTAHPDDLEGFCGGFARLLHDAGAKVYSVIFSEGDRGRWTAKAKLLSKGEMEDTRVSESELAKRDLGVDYIRTLDFDDRAIPHSAEAEEQVAHFIATVEPELLVTFEPQRRRNYYFHPDHLRVGRIVHSVWQNEKSTKRPMLDLLLTTSLTPNAYVPIKPVLQHKRMALKCHTSQRRLNRILFPLLDGIPSRTWGLVTRSGRAEAYRAVVG